MSLIPNIFVNPNTKPPFPLWTATTTYSIGDCVWYGGQNYVAFGFGTVPLNARPDLNQISNNGRGIYNVQSYTNVALNPTGGCWINMTLATPPAMPYSPLPQVPYTTGNAVMYPPGTYKYWRANNPEVFNQTPALTVSGQPNNISTGIVRAQQKTNAFLPTPTWSNFINSQTNVPIPYFPPASTIQTIAPPTTGVEGPTQYWAASAPLTGLPAVPQPTIVL